MLKVDPLVRKPKECRVVVHLVRLILDLRKPSTFFRRRKPVSFARSLVLCILYRINGGYNSEQLKSTIRVPIARLMAMVKNFSDALCVSTIAEHRE